VTTSRDHNRGRQGACEGNNRAHCQRAKGKSGSPGLFLIELGCISDRAGTSTASLRFQCARSAAVIVPDHDFARAPSLSTVIHFQHRTHIFSNDRSSIRPRTARSPFLRPPSSPRRHVDGGCPLRKKSGSMPERSQLALSSQRPVSDSCMTSPRCPVMVNCLRRAMRWLR